jgi:hypothetical protein
MSDWTRGDHSGGLGYYWYDAENDISAFEDVQEAETRWYAWRGDSYAHDTAEQTAVYPTRDEAVAALDEVS